MNLFLYFSFEYPRYRQRSKVFEASDVIKIDKLDIEKSTKMFSMQKDLSEEKKSYH